jgi:hypothetical protein
MIEEKYIELMNKDIDGLLSPKENAALQEYLAKNQDAQAFHDDLHMLSKMLDQVVAVDPPSNLKKNILNSIRLKKHVERERRGLLQSLPSFLNMKVNYRYAFSFSAGLIVGLLIYSLFTNLNKNTFLDNSELTGTIFLDGGSEKLRTADKVEVNLEEITGTIEIKYLKNLALAEINLTAQPEIELLIEFDENDVVFDGFRQLDPSASRIEIAENFLSLTNKGKNRYTVVFKKKPSIITPLNFKIFSNGALLFEKTILANKSHD